MEGGIHWGDFPKMKKKDFIGLMEWMSDQKEREKAEIEKSQNQSGTKTPPSGKMKYLG